MIPVIASAVMGLFAFGSYQLVHLAVKSNALSTMFAMMVAVIVYGVLLIKLGALSAAELKTMPGGTETSQGVQKASFNVKFLFNGKFHRNFLLNKNICLKKKRKQILS